MLEVEARARRTIRERLLEYVCRFLRKARDGLSLRERYLVAGAVIVLTGRLRQAGLDMCLPGEDAALFWRPRVVCLERQPAEKTLDRIEAGELSRGVLPWVPLMAGGGEEANVKRWVRLAEHEPNEGLRRDWGGLVKVFADRVGCLGVWQKALEGWGMWKSQVIEEWRVDGRLEERRGNILRLLELRFPGQVTEAVSQRVSAVSEPKTLDGWFDLAATATAFDRVRDAILAP